MRVFVVMICNTKYNNEWYAGIYDSYRGASQRLLDEGFEPLPDYSGVELEFQQYNRYGNRITAWIEEENIIGSSEVEKP